MALLSMRADKFWKRTGKKISIQGSDVAGFDKSKVECFNCHKMGHFARECRALRKWDWSYMANEEDRALVADGETPIEFALMANIENKVFDNSLCSKDCKKNTDSLNSKINDLKSELSDANTYSTSAEDQNKDTSTSEDAASPNPPKPFVKFVKSKDSQPESKSKEQETPKKSQVKYPEQNRHSNKRPKGNQRNWNNLKSYQLGPEFVFHKKPCFNYGDFSHLANDYRRRVQKETN
nr:hypothetical protein [Tanacetum cinerariifolium]